MNTDPADPPVSVRAPGVDDQPTPPRGLAAALGIAIDLAATFILLSIGWTQGASNLLGFMAGILGCLTVLRLRGTSEGATQQGACVAAVGGSWGLVVVALALGLRGGAVASGLALGLPGWLPVVAGVVVGWGALAFGGLLGRRALAQVGPLRENRWEAAAIGILVAVPLMHLFYVKVLPVMPEESYYWNYAIRPALGYLDHPPMVAWLIGLSQALLGYGELGLRLPSIACGVVLILFVYGLARRLVDRPAALVAAALAAAIPYPFLATGVMTTPDAPLAAAWAASLYFLHRALVGGEGRAWYGAGVALGFGLLSKYTIVTLGLGALAFCVLDRRARAWFLRPEPYFAVLIASLLFAPVFYWNWANDWASFKFQAGGRFGEETRFSLHRMLGNILIVATPLPLVILPLLLAGRWTGRDGPIPDPPHAGIRNRLFVGCVVLLPLAIFAWSALSHPPRLNWTGPIWLATLPLLGWAALRAGALRRFGIGAALRVSAAPVVGGLLVVYALFSYYAVLGIPGVPYPRTFARAAGWPQATDALREVSDRIERETGAAPVVVGMDKYNIASQVSYFGARDVAATGRSPLRATTIRELSGSRLMFTFWDPPGQFRDSTLIMVAPRPEILATERLAPHFSHLDQEIHPLPLSASWPAGNGRPIDEYHYRIGYGYRPRE